MAGRPHGHRERPAVDADLQRVLDRDGVLAAVVEDDEGMRAAVAHEAERSCPQGCQVASGPRWSNAAHARTPTGMRLVSFGPRGGELPAVLDGDEVVPLAQLLRLLGIAVPDMNAVLGLWEHIARGDRRARRVARRRAAAADRRPARAARPQAGERRRHRAQLRRGARGRARTGADPLREAGDVAPRAGGPHRAPRDHEHARLRGRARGGHRPRGPPHRGARRTGVHRRLHDRQRHDGVRPHVPGPRAEPGRHARDRSCSSCAGRVTTPSCRWARRS